MEKLFIFQHFWKLHRIEIAEGNLWKFDFSVTVSHQSVHGFSAVIMSNKNDNNDDDDDNDGGSGVKTQ